MKKLIHYTLLVLLVFVSFTEAQEIIRMKGSDTMVILSQRWAETYMKLNHSVTIIVEGGGSGIGFTELIDGTTDIADASRQIRLKETAQLKSRFNSLGVETKAAKDGLSFYLNNENPVKELTFDQIKKIFTGEITNWKDVGGEDARIIVYGRDDMSGTFAYVSDFILDGREYMPNIQTLPSTSAIVNAVAKDSHAIGYGGAAYARGVKFAAIKKDANSQAFLPTSENIRNNQYPVTRYLYLYTKTAPKGELKKFIDWILSPVGQKLVDEVGYFPLQ